MIENIISKALEERSLEDILQDFDIEPLEAFMHLYADGQIDEDVIEMYHNAALGE